MSKNWTIEQSKAINHTGCNLLISASAGSGKTATIIEKVITLVLNNVEIKDIVMITFTKNAAKEMKDKLMNAFVKMIEDNSVDSIIKKQLYAQLDDIEFAEITTIHSFLSRLIKKHFQELALDPCFSICSDASVYSKKAMDKTFEYYELIDDGDFWKVHNELLNNRKDDFLRECILKLSKYLKVQSDTHVYIKSVALSGYQKDIRGSEIEIIIVNDIHYKIKSVYNKTDDLLMTTDNEELLAIVQYIKNTLGRIIKTNDLFDIAEVVKYATISNPPSTKKNKESNNFYDIKQLCNECKEIFEEYDFLKELDSIIAENFHSKEIVSKLISITQKYDEFFLQYKQADNTLDFDDIEQYAKELLCNENVKEEIKEQYKYIIVDEYQDTNLVQEYIINSIANENIVMVGDVKQSIYKFRLTEPQIFIDKYNLFKKNIGGTTIEFNKNFRSNKAILDFVNYVFDALMTKERGGIDYKDNSQLNAGLNYIYDDTCKAVSIGLINVERDKVEEPTMQGYYSVKEDNNFQQNDNYEALCQADYIAQRIFELVGKKYIYEKAGDEATGRLIEYSDITLLARNRTGINAKVVNILDTVYKLPLNLSSFDTDSLWNDISEFTKYLRVLDNFNQDVPLITTMLSIYGGFGENELAQIKISTSNIKARFFYQRVLAYSEMNGDLAEKVKKFLFRLDNDRLFADCNNIYEVYERFNINNNYEYTLLAKPKGAERRLIIRNFIKYIKSSPFNTSISDYLEYYDKYRKKEDLVNGKLTESNSITVTTIHKSKGLEYPIVFVIGMEQTNRPHGVKSIGLDNILGVSLPIFDEDNRYYKESLLQKAMSIKKRKEEFEEELRLMYVAFTRAKCHLYLVANIKDPTSIGKDYINEPKSYLQLLNNAININVSIKNYCEYVEPKLYDVMEENEAIVAFSPIEPNAQLLSELQMVFNKEYSNKDSVSLATKYTVTEVNKMQREDQEPINDISKGYSRFREYSRDESIERGLMIHKVLENIDFSFNTIEDIRLQLNEMLSNGIISQEEYQKINIDDVYNCLSLDIIKYASGCDTLREQAFIIRSKACDVINTNSQDEILLQGVIDLLIIGKDKNILVDYKASNLSNGKIICTYKKQIDLYSKAVEQCLNIKVDEKYIIVVNRGEQIKID